MWSYPITLQGDKRREFAYMQNLTFPQWLDRQSASAHGVPDRHSCVDFYFRQLRGHEDDPLTRVVHDLRSRYVLVGLSSRMQVSSVGVRVMG